MKPRDWEGGDLVHICLVRITDRRVGLTPAHTKATVRFHRKSCVRASVWQMDVQPWTLLPLFTDPSCLVDSCRVLFHSGLYSHPLLLYTVLFCLRWKHLGRWFSQLFQNKYGVLKEPLFRLAGPKGCWWSCSYNAVEALSTLFYSVWTCPVSSGNTAALGLPSTPGSFSFLFFSF